MRISKSVEKRRLPEWRVEPLSNSTIYKNRASRLCSIVLFCLWNSFEFLYYVPWHLVRCFTHRVRRLRCSMVLIQSVIQRSWILLVVVIYSGWSRAIRYWASFCWHGWSNYGTIISAKLGPWSGSIACLSDLAANNSNYFYYRLSPKRCDMLRYCRFLQLSPLLMTSLLLLEVIPIMMTLRLNMSALLGLHCSLCCTVWGCIQFTSCICSVLQLDRCAWSCFCLASVCWILSQVETLFWCCRVHGFLQCLWTVLLSISA